MGKAKGSRTKRPEGPQRPLEMVRSLLEWAGLSPAPADETSLRMEWRGEGPRVDGLACVLDDRLFVFYLQLREPVPEAARGRVAEFIGQANATLQLGNLEMHPDDGRVRFRTGVDFSQAELTPRLVQNAILAAMDGVEAFSGPLHQVVTGRLAPRAAVEAAQAEREPAARR